MFWTTLSSFSEDPLGRGAAFPRTVDTLVFGYRAKTGWLTLSSSRNAFLFQVAAGL